MHSCQDINNQFAEDGNQFAEDGNPEGYSLISQTLSFFSKDYQFESHKLQAH